MKNVALLLTHEERNTLRFALEEANCRVVDGMSQRLASSYAEGAGVYAGTNPANPEQDARDVGYSTVLQYLLSALDEDEMVFPAQMEQVAVLTLYWIASPGLDSELIEVGVQNQMDGNADRVPIAEEIKKKYEEHAREERDIYKKKAFRLAKKLEDL